MRQPPRVLVVEDHADVRELVMSTIDVEGYDVRGAADANEALHEIQAFNPDLLVVDVAMPETDGFTLVRQVRTQSDVPILFLSAHQQLEQRLEGFNAGGDDYLAKPFEPEELIARVRALLKRSHRDSLGSWQLGDLVVDRGTRQVAAAGRPVELTKLEFDLLDVLGSRPGRVWSKELLLETVWGSSEYPVNVVEVHVSQLRKKLGEHGNLLRTVRGVGYAVRAEPAG